MLLLSRFTDSVEGGMVSPSLRRNLPCPILGLRRDRNFGKKRPPTYRKKSARGCIKFLGRAQNLENAYKFEKLEPPTPTNTTSAKREF